MQHCACEATERSKAAPRPPIRAAQVELAAFGASRLFVTISIRPFGAGWTVQVDGVSNDIVYRNGTDAETAARSLGEMLVGQGKPVEIHLYLRDGALASRLICTPGGEET